MVEKAREAARAVVDSVVLTMAARIVTLSEAYTGGTPRPCVLYGSASATDDLGTLIYTLHPETAKRMYLRQYLSGG